MLRRESIDIKEPDIKHIHVPAQKSPLASCPLLAPFSANFLARRDTHEEFRAL